MLLYSVYVSYIVTRLKQFANQPLSVLGCVRFNQEILPRVSPVLGVPSWLDGPDHCHSEELHAVTPAIAAFTRFLPLPWALKATATFWGLAWHNLQVWQVMSSRI